MKKLQLCSLVGLAVLATAQLRAQPTFDLAFENCRNLTGEAGSALSEELIGTLTTTNAGPGQGSQGWSVSVAAGGGVTIASLTTAGTTGAITPDGLRDGGFEKTELANAAISTGGCMGASGAVSAIVLSFTLPITLPDGNNTQRIVRVTVAGTYPGEGLCSDGSLAFVDGCRGSGQPVGNRITSEGNTIIPSLGRCDFMFCGIVPPPICPNPSAALQIVMQSENTGHVVGLPFASGSPPGLAPTPDPLAPAEIVAIPGQTNVYAAIVSQISAEALGGVQGWSLAVSIKDGLTLVGVSTNGTTAANAPAGLRSGGFEKTETVDPTRTDCGGCMGLPQGPGAVSAIVLSFTEPITLAEDSTATVLCVTVSGDEGDSGQICWRNGLRGSGQPVNNVATVAGETRQYFCCQAANVSFAVPPVSDFIRCDPNNDGQNDLADAVWIVNELFRGGPATACPAAADCNADGIEDLTDAIYAVNYQFRGGSAPPAPFPSCGGRETLTDPSQCPSGSTLCPS